MIFLMLMRGMCVGSWGKGRWLLWEWGRHGVGVKRRIELCEGERVIFTDFFRPSKLVRCRKCFTAPNV